MLDYVKRLAATGAAYQAAEVAAKGIAVFTLPLYTSYVARGQYGDYSSLFTAVILASIVLRIGIGEAFVRFYFEDEDEERRRRIAKTATASVAWLTSVTAALVAIFAGPIARLLLGAHSPAGLVYAADVGLWAFTNLEMAYAQLRVEERRRAYMVASMGNVALTIAATVPLVVAAHLGAKGLLIGNFGASTVVVLGLWVSLRRRVSLRFSVADVRAMLRFGAPTVPADAFVYCLQVFDRFYILHVVGKGAAGEYGVALQLATSVFVLVRGFQYAWPPLAYSIKSDETAQRLYAVVATWFVLATGIVVTAVALLGRWIVRLLAAGPYFGAHSALPWLALGWSLYGLYQMAIVVTGRKMVTRRNVPAAIAGLAVNVLLVLWLVPGPTHPAPGDPTHPGGLFGGGAGLGIAGGGIALCGAYATMLLVIHSITWRLFPIRFEWRRLAELVAVLAGTAVSGELLLPTAGVGGLLARLAWLAWVPALLFALRFLTVQEVEQARALVLAAVGRGRARTRGRPSAPS
ncbi:MAG: lipopolysaccharide biosynthesis protein [Solirubrobacteraceae bacterium]